MIKLYRSFIRKKVNKVEIYKINENYRSGKILIFGKDIGI